VPLVLVGLEVWQNRAAGAGEALGRDRRHLLALLEPTTMTRSATKSTFTRSAWPFGSTPETGRRSSATARPGTGGMPWRILGSYAPTIPR
jgi:hypothetical protein